MKGSPQQRARTRESESVDAKAGRSLKPPPEWIRRLFAGADLHVPQKRLAWNAVHIEQFLRWRRKAAPQSWECFWFFPSRQLSVDPREAGAVRRHHVHENGIARAVGKAAKTVGLAKHVKPHTLRH